MGPLKGDQKRILLYFCMAAGYAVKAHERYTVRGFAGLVRACSCLSAFVVVSSSGPAVSFAEFPDCLRSVGSGAQM